MRRNALLIALLAMTCSAVLAQDALARWVRSGTIEVGRGAAGVRLGDERAEVVSRLGRPFYENQNGYMQYAPDRANNIFDVYLDEPGPPGNVTQLIISGGRFRIGRIEVFEPGAIPRMRRRFGDRFRRRLSEGPREPIYRVRARHLDRPAWTDFLVTRHGRRGLVTNVIIYFAD
jgi:hypothetical protein